MGARKKDEETVSFEESLRRLEKIVERLEQGDVPLEDALRMYEEGIKLSHDCARKLADAELVLKRLGKDLEGNFTLLEEEPEA
jgi:exodeoxyribonuclease VII small subunit